MQWYITNRVTWGELLWNNTPVMAKQFIQRYYVTKTRHITDPRPASWNSDPRPHSLHSYIGIGNLFPLPTGLEQLVSPILDIPCLPFYPPTQPLPPLYMLHDVSTPTIKINPTPLSACSRQQSFFKECWSHYWAVTGLERRNNRRYRQDYSCSRHR